ncbi:MAG: nucleotidyltransferase family protein [Anaerovoracaceae bacterium]
MNPSLIIMAAGMGSRYGGLKQIDPVTDKGEIILDFSMYDAMMAGFEDIVFIIKEEMEEDFRKLIDDRAGKHLNVNYAFQKLDDIPAGFEVPKDRLKPWGTSHAVLAARNIVKGAFAVINADDYYGPDAFHKMCEFLEKEEKNMAMIGYELKKTITENGHVARGVCQVSPEGYLTNIDERTMIKEVDGNICYSEDEGKTWNKLPREARVSMNFWGYPKSMMKYLEDGLTDFLEKTLKENPLKGEYLLPTVTDRLIKENKATVKVLPSSDRWYGVTYKEDKPGVMAALQAMKDRGEYPDVLFK